MTSALESNFGLNAIAQFTGCFDNSLPQSLGTGQLYHNNFPSDLQIEKGALLKRPIESYPFDDFFEEFEGSGFGCAGFRLVVISPICLRWQTHKNRFGTTARF